MPFEIESTQKIILSGDAEGIAEIPEKGNVAIYVKVNRATMANLAKEVLTIPSARFATESSHAAAADVASRCTGNSKTATRLKDERTITFSGDIDAEINFDGTQDLIVDAKVKRADSAICDDDGNNIVDTYAKKDELSQIQFRIEEYNGAPCLFAIHEGKLYKFIGEEVTFSEN